jgi:hypothetical protein
VADTPDGLASHIAEARYVAGKLVQRCRDEDRHSVL